MKLQAQEVRPQGRPPGSPVQQALIFSDPSQDRKRAALVPSQGGCFSLYNPKKICYDRIDEISRKGGIQVTKEELIAVTIDQFGDLQRIKKANGQHETKELDYLLKLTIAKLPSLGVNVEDITLN